jgi:methionine synthase II (cobalamin-independent)
VPELETVDALKRRIDEAAKMLPLDQLAISPQCGFASDMVGNLLSENEQKRKLERGREGATGVGQIGEKIRLKQELDFDPIQSSRTKV